MPSYPYICDVCDESFDVTRPMERAGDGASCPRCGQKARRVFGSHPIIFRPEGWNLPPSDPNYSKNLPVKTERPFCQR